MMREDHKIPTDGGHFTPCGWCHAGGGEISLNGNPALSKTLKELKFAWTKKLTNFSIRQDALVAGPNNELKMYPDIHGVRLIGRNGHWWIYRECDCDNQMAWWKAKQKLKIIMR